MKRSALVRRTPLKARKQTSARTACIRAVKLRSGGRCEAILMLRHTCQGPFDVHEIKSRARGGDASDPSNCLHICRFIHRWAHTHPEGAEAVGLLKPSWS